MIKPLISASALVFAVLGAMTLFLPGEVVDAAGMDPSAELPIQLLAGGLFAMAGLNWMGRGAVYGGIYGRPMVIANIYFGVLTTTTTLSALLGDRMAAWGWVIVVLFGLHTIGFGWVMRSPPWKPDPAIGT